VPLQRTVIVNPGAPLRCRARNRGRRTARSPGNVRRSDWLAAYVEQNDGEGATEHRRRGAALQGYRRGFFSTANVPRGAGAQLERAGLGPSTRRARTLTQTIDAEILFDDGIDEPPGRNIASPAMPRLRQPERLAQLTRFDQCRARGARVGIRPEPASGEIAARYRARGVAGRRGCRRARNLLKFVETIGMPRAHTCEVLGKPAFDHAAGTALP
jgi:hypothetical protein